MVTYGLSTAFAVGGIALFTSLSTTANADVSKVEQAINKARSAQITFYSAGEGGTPKLKGTVWYDSGNYRVEQPGKAPMVMKGHKTFVFDVKKKTWTEQKGKSNLDLLGVTRKFTLVEYSTPLQFTGQSPDGKQFTGFSVDLPFDNKGQVSQLGKSEFVATKGAGSSQVTFVANKVTSLPKAMATYKVDKKGNKVPTGYATFTFNKQIPQEKFMTFRWVRVDDKGNWGYVKDKSK